MKARKVGNKVGALASIFDGGALSPAAPEAHPPDTPNAQQNNEWETFGSNASPLGTLDSPKRIFPRDLKASSADNEADSSKQGGENNLEAVTPPVVVPVVSDPALDESSAQEIYFQTLLNKTFNCLKLLYKRKLHVASCQQTISSKNLRRIHARIFLPWKERAAEKASLRHRCSQISDVREARELIAEMTFLRTILVCWNEYVHEKSHLLGLQDALFARHHKCICSMVIRSWNNICILKSYMIEVADRRARQVTLLYLSRWVEAKNRVAWHRQTMCTGHERAQKLQVGSVIEAWRGWIRHREHLDVMEAKVVQTSVKQLMLRSITKWLEWVMACIRGKHMMKIRYMRKWKHYTGTVIFLLETGEAVVQLHERTCVHNVLNLWRRATVLAMACDNHSIQRFRRFLAAWFAESHTRVRLRRMRHTIDLRRSVQIRIRTFKAWHAYAKWRISVDTLQTSFRKERDASQEVVVLEGWVQVSWKRRVLRRVELLLRNKSNRSLMSSCLERWFDHVVHRKQESLIEMQKDERMARSASAMVLVAWQRAVLYLKYMRLTEEKIAVRTDESLRRSAFRKWHALCRACNLRRSACLRVATHAWKKAAWISACSHASKAVAAQLGRIKVLRAVIREWSKYEQEGRWCDSFRERQILAGGLRIWRDYRMRWKRYRQSEKLLHRAFVVTAGGKQLSSFLRQWLDTARHQRTILRVAAPTLKRLRHRLQRVCLHAWIRRARRSKLKTMVQEEMHKERAVQTQRRVMRKWSERTELAQAIEETISENAQAKENDLKVSCFAVWCQLRTYKIQLLSAAQYTEEATAEYCLQKVVAEWAAAVKFQQHLDRVEQKITKKACDRQAKANIAAWSDWIKACNSDMGRCGRGALHLWKKASTRKIFMRSSKAVATRKFSHNTRRVFLEQWRSVTAQRKDACKVTGVWDKREVTIRRRAIVRLLRAWLQRVHRSVANRVFSAGLAIQVSAKLRLRAMKSWRLCVAVQCMRSEQTAAVQANAARSLLKYCMREWCALMKYKGMMVKFIATALAGYDKSLGKKVMSIWVGRVRKKLALQSVLHAVDQMYCAKLTARSWKNWLDSLDYARVMETAEQVFSVFSGRVVVSWVWSAWRDRVKWANTRHVVLTDFGGKLCTKHLSAFTIAWRQLCRVQAKGKRFQMLGTFVDWADVTRWQVFLVKALPMTDKWRVDKLLRPIVRNWFIMTAIYRRYANILLECRLAMKKRILPGLMRAWLVLASKREILENVSHMVWYKFSSGVRGRMLARWRDFTYRSAFFHQVYAVLLRRHVMRILKGCMREWRDAKNRWKTKGQKLDVMEDAHDKFTAERLVRILRGWQQYIMSNAMRQGMVRRKQFLKITPSFRAWIEYVNMSMRFKTAGGALAAVAKNELVRRVFDAWRKAAPFLRLLWLGEVIVGRRTSHTLLRSVITRWAKAVQANTFWNMLQRRLAFHAWFRLASRRTLCRTALATALAPRRKQKLLECTRAWRLVKERTKYFRAAVDAMRESLRRRCMRRVMRSWLLHVGYLRPKRLATFSAANLADVRRRLIAFQGWQRYAAAKATRNAAVVIIMQRR
jgi:hypothetical protein